MPKQLELQWPPKPDDVSQEEYEATCRKLDAAERSQPAPIILRNSLKCKSCGDEIESTHRHDFVMCKCGKVGADGGKEYLRRIGNQEDYEDTSIMQQTEVPRNTNQKSEA